jgi:predicted GNAT family acetyltransferase
MLGFRGPLEGNPRYYGDEDPLLAAVVDGNEVVAAAVRTPPHNLVLSRAPDAAVDALVDAFAAAGLELPGVSGPAAARFGRLWSSATGVTARREFEERLYEATEVLPPREVGGRMRACTEDDSATLVAWMNAFFAEALPGAAPSDADRFVARRLAEAGEALMVWDDGEPVSLAGYAGETPTGIRIGPVYTPPELRGRGYASALTAALTQQLLASGRRSCFLFTDATNPTSNSIYQRIGYRFLGELSRWAFDRA